MPNDFPFNRNNSRAIYLNQIPTQAPPEHIHAAVAACHFYGRFPIPENLDVIEFKIPKHESFADFLKTKVKPSTNQYSSGPNLGKIRIKKTIIAAEALAGKDNI